MFNFDYSYLSLPDKFYSLVKPDSFPAPEMFLFNDKLCDELNVSIESQDDFIASKSFAQSYAGHQFGHFTMLGDGRAIILGEHLTENKHRFDIQLKGSNKKPY